ncbi:hypothetical protein DC522_16245 [Microvirga sp. KLBC 81]|nr:hypothetical protein DC522_16245 [Microvirga sp. KLBC 81]
MQQAESFPLEAIPPRVRRAIIREFQGRWPTVQEVAQISDRHWLATPDIGPLALEKIRSILQSQSRRNDNSPPQLIDAEVLDRLEAIQEELRRIQCTLDTRISQTLRKGPRAKTEVNVQMTSARPPD